MRRRTCIARSERYYLACADRACDMRFYRNDWVWLPRYYSLSLIPRNDGRWSNADRERVVTHPLYREYPVLNYRKQNVEIAAVCAAWVNTYRRNKNGVPNMCAEFQRILTDDPYESIMDKDYLYWRHERLDVIFDRYTWNDLIYLFDRLNKIYEKYPDLEAAVAATMRVRKCDHIRATLYLLEGVVGFENNIDTLYRLNMMFRWLTLKYKVDIGIWTVVAPKDLHVCVRFRDINYFPKFLSLKSIKKGDRDIQRKVDDVARALWPRCPSVMDYAVRFLRMPNHDSIKPIIPPDIENRQNSPVLSKLVGATKDNTAVVDRYHLTE